MAVKTIKLDANKFLLLICAFSLLLISPQHAMAVEDLGAEGYYDLYSWNDAGGFWDFSLRPSWKNSGYTIDEIVHDSIHGLPRLESELSRLPAGTHIYWFDRLHTTIIPSDEVYVQLKYPPSETIEEVQHFAKLSGLVMEQIHH